MHRLRLLSAALLLMFAAALAPAETRAQSAGGAMLFGGYFCPGGVKELGMPFPDVRLCARQGDYFPYYMGSIILMGSKFCPSGTLEAAGQTLPLSRYAALFSLFGTKFGGDGKASFGLPDLRGKGPIANPALVYCVVTVGDYPRRE